ncbi:pseudouridine synthase [Hysterangium stoloniferum]|nr:pseudouridine synthase [Hysterangium stoloniferum]
MVIGVDAQWNSKNQRSKKKRGNVGPKDGRKDRRGTRGTREGSPGIASDDDETKIRLPKRLVALLIGFCGTGCSGMQIQPNVRTIEGVLFDAMVKVGAVSQDNADDPVKVGLARAARTDAGVHAAGNLISIKMITTVPGIPDIVARINEELPPEIRLWSFLRTQNSFNARTSCDSRMYTYFLPTYTLIPPKPDSGLARALRTVGEELDIPLDANLHPFWEGADLSNPPEMDLQRKRLWRIDADTLVMLRTAVTKYIGTHNFHNFTLGNDFTDRSNQRNMKRIEVQESAVYGTTEWIPILFHGQSFMLHQRKMVCAAILTCRTGTPPSLLEKMFGPDKVVVPKAPALGLLLEQPLFESYNKRVVQANSKFDRTDPMYRPIIDFEVHRATIEKFKQDQIYSRMRAQEETEATQVHSLPPFDAWIRSIDCYAGRDFSYLNPKAIIPPVAVLKKGQRRMNAFRERRRFDKTGPLIESTTADFESEDDMDIDQTKLKDMEG